MNILRVPHSQFRKILTLAFFTGSFIFFAFFYQYHLYYLEQMQFFRLSPDYILKYFHKPASVSCLVGDFLTQFYFFKTGGAFIITGSLSLLWYLIDWVTTKLYQWKYSYLLALLITSLVLGLHFTMVYPLAATISLITALAVFRFYTTLKRSISRIIAGLVLVPLLYMAVGFAVYLFIFVVLLYEIKLKQNNGWPEWAYRFTLIILVICTPFAMRIFYYLTIKQAYRYPVTEISSPVPNFMFENLFALDCEWYFNHPEKTLEIAQKTPDKTRYVIYYYNLASAALNKMPQNLFAIKQVGLDGLFVPFNEQTNYLNLLIGNEVYYFIGDMNAAQHYVLMANTFSPKSESTRMIRRMVEINLINGEYAAAQKYLKMLDQTLFYRAWAHKMEKFLFNDALCNKTSWIADKRAKMPCNDHIIANSNNFVSSLYYLLDDHPDNQAALNYLLSTCLLYKDINSFYNVLTTYKYQSTGDYLPEIYQEALIIYFDMHRNDKSFKNFRFSKDVIQQSTLFKQKYQQTRGDKKVLVKNFGHSYWFYFGFGHVPN